MPKPVAPEEHARRMEVYRLKLTDGQSAERLRIPRTTYRSWRELNNLERHFPPGGTFMLNKKVDNPKAKPKVSQRKTAPVKMQDVLTLEGCQLVKTFLHTLVTLAGRESKVPDVGAFIREWRKQKFGISRGKWVGMRTMWV